MLSLVMLVLLVKSIKMVSTASSWFLFGIHGSNLCANLKHCQWLIVLDHAMITEDSKTNETAWCLMIRSGSC